MFVPFLNLDSPVSLKLCHASSWHQIPHVTIVCSEVIVSWTLTSPEIDHLSICLVFTHSGEWVAVYLTPRAGAPNLLKDDIINIPENWILVIMIMIIVKAYLMTGVMWLPFTKLSEVSVCLYRHFCPQGHFSHCSPVPCRAVNNPSQVLCKVVSSPPVWLGSGVAPSCPPGSVSAHTDQGTHCPHPSPSSGQWGQRTPSKESHDIIWLWQFAII